MSPISIRPRWPAYLLACSGISVLAGTHSASLGLRPDIRATDPAPGFPPTPYTINSVVGADRFYAEGYAGFGVVVGNAEAGHVWGGTDPGAPAGSYEAGHAFLRGQVSRYVGSPNFTPGFPVEYDYHATMVGHAIAGAGPLTGSSMGVSPFSQLWSGAIATSFGNAGDPRPTGTFEITDTSFHRVYSDFFYGANPTGRGADVVNGSWGGGPDTDASGILARATDGLAKANPLTTYVVSAGNDGPAFNSVTDISAGYNNISVGALSGPWATHPFKTLSEFSSRGPSDFYNPDTQETVPGVRATVDLAAPGEDLRLAAYLYPTGGNSGVIGGVDPFAGIPQPLDGYSFLFSSGTSFSAPIVSGGVALLKEVAYSLYGDNDAARDTRVVKSVLQSSADHGVGGWKNGQYTDGSGVVRTDQSLDFRYGAGGLDLNRTFETFASNDSTADVAGLTYDGTISRRGWDFGSVDSLDDSNTYLFDQELGGRVSVTLNWFVDRTYGYLDRTEEIQSDDLSFANLDLEIWTVDEFGNLVSLYAASESLYNNTEHLYVHLAKGRYAIRVLFDGFVYGDTSSVEFGLAWAVPEASGRGAILGLAMMVLASRRRGMVRAA